MMGEFNGMVTQILNSSQLFEASQLLQHGELVVFPTETVYGLGANALDEGAVQKIFQVKGRPHNNPLIVHVASWELIPKIVTYLSPKAEKLMEQFWPGPLTLVLPAASILAPSVTSGLSTVGLRWPKLEIAQKLLQMCELPIAAPSANKSGRPSPTTFSAAVEEMNGLVSALLQGPDCEVGLESTVVGVFEQQVRIFRPGAITPHDIENVLNIKVILPDHDTPKVSPGMQHRHYRPRCAVRLYTEVGEVPTFDPTIWIIGPHPLPNNVKAQHVVVGGLDEYAKRLYSFFADAEKAGASAVWCWLPPNEGLGLALNDRLRRAAGLQ